MNYRKNLLQLLTARSASGTVWTADLEYWITGREQDGTADPAWRTEEGFLRLCADLKVMPYYFYGKDFSSFWAAFPQYRGQVEVETSTSGHAATTIWKTPIGTISQTAEFLPSSCSTALRKHAVATKQDLEALLYLMENRTLVPADMEAYRGRLELWERYRGIPAVAMPRSPLAALFYEWAGIENGVYLMLDNLQTVERIFEVMNEQEKPVIDALCGAEVPLVHFADNLSSDNFTGYYDAYMGPGHRRRIERFHSGGVYCAVHLDGWVEGLLPKVAAAGFDAIEALTPQPGGDLPVEKMREVAGDDKVILWGGLPGVLFAPPYTWTDMEAHLKKLRQAWEGTPFVLGVADQIPPNGDVSYCPRIAEIVRGW
jgi:hypothetical protein